MTRLLAALAALTLSAADWPSYRGPGATGIGVGSFPASWNADATIGRLRNVLWKAAVPGLGHSSPIVSGNRLFVATAVLLKGEAPLKIGLYGAGDSADDNSEQEWRIYCFDTTSGRELWSAVAHRGIPRAARHTKATHANTTLATDGKRLIAFFGSEGLYSYTLDGKLEWKKDLGTLDMAPHADRSLSWGFASSPALFRDTVIVQADAKSAGFLASFEAATGRELWRVARDQVSVGSWATPGIIETAQGVQVVANGYPFITAYDWKTGKELWRLEGGGDVPVPVPFAAEGRVWVANAHGSKAPLWALQPGTGKVQWVQDRNGSYLQTPVVYRGIAYACTSNGVFKAYDAATGERLYEQRLGTGGVGFTSSPVAADGKVYVTSEEGETYVIKAGRAFEQIALNPLGQIVLSTPALSANTIFFRTRSHIVALAVEK